MKTKICIDCHQTKRLTEFKRSSLSLDGRIAVCKACSTNRKTSNRTEYYQRVVKPKKMMEKYGLTQNDIDAMYERQKGCCPICTNSFDKYVIDHCHASGAVRGLLCNDCNRGLGDFKDNYKSLQNAINYLRNSA